MASFGLNELENYLKKLKTFKTKDIDLLSKRLIKDKIDVSFLKDYCLERNEFHRIYFQVNLAYLDYKEQFCFF